MSQAMTSLPNDLAHLQQRLTEFRNAHRVRSRLPEPLWAEAAELATRYGVHRTARVLHLDYVGLKTRVEGRKQPKRTHTVSSAPNFVELVGPAAATVASCRIELEGSAGKLRLEQPVLEATALANLIREFLGH